MRSSSCSRLSKASLQRLNSCIKVTGMKRPLCPEMERKDRVSVITYESILNIYEVILLLCKFLWVLLYQTKYCINKRFLEICDCYCISQTV